MNMSKSKIFVVEDDPLYAKALTHQLARDPDFEVRSFSNGTDFLKLLHERPDVITLDHHLPDISGLELIKRIKQALPNSEVIILSAQEDVATAVQLLQAGAFDYIIKTSDSFSKLWHVVHQANEKRSLRQEVANLRDEIAHKYHFQHYILGSSPPMQRLFSVLEKAAKSPITVSITGQTGTGKELIAKAIHFNSNRMKKNFVALNVAAIPKELVESELFGHEKGAFTGADQNRIGKFEEANKGTLFLDEIGEMDLQTQSKLLRALQEREITRLGSNKVIPLDVRIIVATHRNLLQEVHEGRFREDLYYRLLGLSIELPPLKDRGNDVILLAKHFAASYCKEINIPGKEFSPRAIEKLKRHSYPGNVRELKALIEVAVVMSDTSVIDEQDIQFVTHQTIQGIMSESMTLDDYNYQIIRWYLDRNNNNVVKAAKQLNVGKSTIYRFIKAGKITH